MAISNYKADVDEGVQEDSSSNGKRFWELSLEIDCLAGLFTRSCCGVRME